MEAVEYQKMFAVEDRHWWFRGKREWVAALLKRHVGKRVDGEILDIGCGTGANLVFLSTFGKASGLDINEAALEKCKERGLGDAVHRGSANELPFQDGRFAVVTALDVLYHRQIDPAKCLSEIHRVLKPGGHLVITDSALPILSGPHDKAVWARERYTKATLRRTLEQAGFQPQRLSYTNFFLFPLVFTVRMLERLRPGGGSSVDEPPSLANGLLFGLLELEGKLLNKGLDFPVGSSIVCLARKG